MCHKACALINISPSLIVIIHVCMYVYTCMHAFVKLQDILVTGT